MAELFAQVRQKARQVADAAARPEDVIIVALDDHVAAILVHELGVAALDVKDFAGRGIGVEDDEPTPALITRKAPQPAN